MAGVLDESKPEDVKTGADRLLELVRSSKEIALAEASKQLGVSQATVEAWSNFLEEDGLVSMKYKFTTPYITVPEIAEAKKHKKEISPVEGLEFNELKGHLESVSEALSKAAAEKQAGEFGMLKQTYASLISRLKATHDTLIEQADITPQKKVQLNEAISAIERNLEISAADASEGNFDQASASYSKLYRQAQDLLGELNKLYEQMVAVHAMEETKDYKDLITRAYELMSEGRVEEANDLYNRLKFAHENLAKDFNERKRQMEDDLVKLNKDLARSADQSNLQKLDAISKRIMVLVHAGGKFLKQGEFDTAESYYIAIRHEYELLPPGFAEQKKELQQSVLGFYSLLAQQREKSIGKKFGESASQLAYLLKQTQEMLRESRIDEAVRAYKEISRMYKALPAGFLKEKSELQEKILPLHTAITSMYTKESVDVQRQKSAQLLELLAQMNAQIEGNQLREAEDSYQQIRQLYKSLPKGFLHEETMLQNQIVEAYERYLTRAKHAESAAITEALSKISALADKAEAALKAKDYNAANTMYLSMISIYSGMPAGFVMQKRQVRERMLHMYKSLLSLSGEQGGASWREGNDAIELPEPMRPQRIASSPAPAAQNVEIHAREPRMPAEIKENEKAETLPENGDQDEARLKAILDEGKAWEAEGAESETREESQTDMGADPMADLETMEASDIHKIDEEIEDIEQKIDELKRNSKATVKFPEPSGQ